MNSHLAEFYTILRDKLAKFGVESPDLEARILLKHHLNVEWGDVIANSDRKITEFEQKAIENDLLRRQEGEPLARIHGSREFYGLEFQLGPDTLEPRPDTEVLIDRALEIYGKAPPERILDLGTGTGCIIITLLTKWPETRGMAVDLSAGALETTRINAAKHGVLDRLDLKQGDWGDGITGKFDLVLSNPPYIRTPDLENLQKEVRNHDPILALDGGFDGFEAYKKIFSQLPGLLNEGGKALFEIGQGQEEGIARLGREARIRIIHTQPDYAGITRVVEISYGDN